MKESQTTGFRMRRRAVPVLGAVGVIAFVAGCAGGGVGDPSESGTVEDMDPVVLRVSDVSPETASNVVALGEWMDYVTAETGGKVTFETYFSGTLHSSTEALTALEQGLTDITFFYPGHVAAQAPIASWVNQSFAAEGAVGFPHTGMASTVAITTLFEESEDLRSELAAYNAVPFALWSGQTFDLLCTEPVDSLASARGKLVNTGGVPWIDEVTALGMTNEYIELPEEYEALQRGVINCVTGSVSPLMTRGAWEVAKYYTPVDLSPPVTNGYLFNSETWANLPLEVRQIMHDGKQIIMGGFNEISYERYATFAEEAPEMGVEFLDPSELNDALAPLIAEKSDSVVEGAPPTTTDPQGDFDFFSAKVDEVLGTIVGDLGVPQVEKTPEGLIDLYLSVRDVSWSGYEEMIKEALAPYRPE